jgi:hypothetical protein
MCARAARAARRCYNHGVRWWPIVLVLACGSRDDNLVPEFHSVERHCLAMFSDALHRQAQNQIDELAFAQIVDRDVLPPWHEFHMRVEHEPDSELVIAMRRYFADRETAWQAFAVTLRHDDPQALATYRQKNAEADADAQALAKLLPR